MRRTLLLATAIVIFSLGALDARAMPVYQAPGAAFAELDQATAMAPAASADQPAPVRGAETVRPVRWDARTLRRQIGPTLRTAFLLGFAGVVFGLSAVGVKSLWVVEEAEYAALGQDLSGEASLAGDRMLTCLGDYPA